MAGPPVFQRSPRLRPELPAGEAEIPAPPPAPTEPSMSLASVLISLVPGLLSAFIMYGFSRARGAGTPMTMLYSLPMMAAGYLVQIGHFWTQKRRHAAAVERRDGAYREMLNGRRKQLEQARQMQQEALRQIDPHPADCAGRAIQRDPRLWERSPRDDDFLALRLGLGKLPLTMTLKLPQSGGALEIDPLHKEALSLGPEFAEVAGVPIRLPLREAGAAGLVGERTAVLAALRALAMQIATHHSPDDVKIVALFPAAEIDDWAFLRWLPHVWTDDRQTRLLAADRETAHRLLTDLFEQLNRRKLQGAGESSPALLFLLGDTSLTENEPLMPLLLREGSRLGAFALVTASRKEELPMECRAIAELGLSRSCLIQMAPIRLQTEFFPDEAPAVQADELARALAPIRPHRMAGPAEIPRKVALLDTLAVSQVEALNVGARWRASEPFASLAVPIGARAGGERLLLDLHERAHGPHGLVAGATGSGKSELLQTLIASLAVSFHPHEVAFMMIDYKGGGMANAFKGLPHLTGTITNLEGGLARRALAALKAELKRRQRLLGEAGVTHIDEYIRLRRQRPGMEPLPHLILVVDEFAELKAEQPEFMRELISAVRVGRSLGVHLILATQKPAGVVDEQIWSNTRFRLCLRVERPGDSQEVLRCPDAALITAPGRAYFQVGNNERFELFQAGWGGAPYGAGQQADPYEVAEVGLDGRRYRVSPVVADVGGPSGTQLDALVGHLQNVARREGIEPVRGPWVAPLPGFVGLSDLGGGAGGWLEPVIGLVDDPEQQRQEPLRINLGKEGHLAVYGAPGNGKTTLLQTLVVSLALRHTPDEVHIYVLDCSGRTLRVLEPLPHVGAVITADETERTVRLLRYLLQQLEERKERFARLGVGTFAAHRQAGGEPLPAIVVAMDNFPVLAGSLENAEEMVARLAREGGNHGIHLILTAGSPSALRHRVASNITMAVALTLADRSEYGLAVGRTGGMEPANLPGRGLVKGAPPLEFQTALPAPGETEWERSGALRALCESLGQAWQGARPRPIRALPEVVPLAFGSGIGLEVADLEPFSPSLDEGPHFLVSGPVGSGKTGLLVSWVLALASVRSCDELEIWLADCGAGGLAPLRSLPHVKGYAVDGSDLAVMAGSLQQRERGRTSVLVIDDYDQFRVVAPEDVKSRLEQIVRRERGSGFHLLAAGPTAVFSQYGYEGLTKALLEQQTGFVLGSNEHGDLGLFGLQPPSGEPRRLPPGQGAYVRRGRSRAVKIALAGAARDWVERISRKVGGLV
ncbi:MAG TPA: type VII secretion protein EssC [Symbiobacteriaceae bacterium]|nr:type VII secretion protein EssC [Symbiobacteriaceae bacterium]